MMKKFFAAMILSATIFLTGCGNSTVERSENFMGTVITLKATGANAQVAVDESFLAIDALIKNIFADVKKIEDASDSGEFVEVSPDVYKILETSQKFSELTDGAFDVTCGAAIELWGFRDKNFRVPTDDELADVKNFVGYKHLHLRGGKVRVDSGVKINLGGVAKGYGVDIVRKIFAAHGITDGLIDFGTSTIFAFGAKKIGIKNPREPDKLSTVVELENSALSTSGDYEKFFVANGRRYCHIFNPKTCAPVEFEKFSVTVVVDGNVELCATVADILSTAAFVDRERVEKILSSCKLPAKIIHTQEKIPAKVF